MTDSAHDRHLAEMHALLAQHGVADMLASVTDSRRYLGVRLARDLIEAAEAAGAGPEGIRAVLRERPVIHPTRRDVQAVVAAAEPQPTTTAQGAEPAPQPARGRPAEPTAPAPTPTPTADDGWDAAFAAVSPRRDDGQGAEPTHQDAWDRAFQGV